MVESESESGGQIKRPFENTDGETTSGTNPKRQNMGGQPLLKLLVPNYVAGALIGKGGGALNDLKAQYGGFVRLSVGYYPGTNERVVIVTGDMSELRNINNHIMVKVEDPGRDKTMRNVPINPGRSDKVLIILTDLAAGLLIGRGGGTIKSVQEESHAKLSVAMPDKAPVKGERLLTISGTFEQRIAACNLVIEKVSGDPSNMSNTRSTYDEMAMPGATSFAGGMGGGRQGGGGGRQGGGGGYEPQGGGGGGLVDFHSRGGHVSELLKPRVTIEVDVVDALVGPIMGKQGGILKEMVHRSGGARFHFADRAKDEEVGGGQRTLSITGDIKQTQNGYSLLCERLAQVENESLRFGASESQRFGASESQRFGASESQRYGASESQRYSTSESHYYGAPESQRYGAS